MAISDIGNKAGKLLLITVLIALRGHIILRFSFVCTVGSAFFPGIITPGSSLAEVDKIPNAMPYFSISIPPVISVMTALVFSFTLGLGLASMRGGALKEVSQ